MLEPTTYLENVSAPWSADRVVRDGVIAYRCRPARCCRGSPRPTSPRAVERAIAGSVVGRFALPGPVLTGHEVAAAIGVVLGRPVCWEAISPEAFGDLLRPHVGDHAADGTAAVYRMRAESPPAPAPDPGPAEEALGWAPRDVSAWARAIAWPLRLAAEHLEAPAAAAR